MSDRKWPVLELSTDEMSLERIFLRLTDGNFNIPKNKTKKIERDNDSLLKNSEIFGAAKKEDDK